MENKRSESRSKSKSLAALGFAAWSVAAAVWGGCGGTESRPHAPNPTASAPPSTLTLLPTGNTPQFRFRGLDGREVSSDVAVGRNSVLAFVATFDWASQAQARFVAGIARNHKPRTNCFAIVIERAENAMLVDAFVNTLALPYPVAHVPTEKLAKSGLKSVKSVPSVLVLDAGGNLVWRSRGLATEDALEEVLNELEKAPGKQRLTSL